MLASRLMLAATVAGGTLIVGCESNNAGTQMKHDHSNHPHTAPYSDGTPKQDNMNSSAPSTGVGPGKAGSSGSNTMGPVRSEGGSDK